MSEAMKYKLPPLPKPDTHCFDEDTWKDVWSHSTEQMQAYAIAAIEAQASEVQQVPLTDEQIVDAYCKGLGMRQYVEAYFAGARFAEAAHNIVKE